MEFLKDTSYRMLLLIAFVSNLKTLGYFLSMAQSQKSPLSRFYASVGAGGTRLLRRSVVDLLYYRG